MDSFKAFWRNCSLYNKLVTLMAPLLLVCNCVIGTLIILEIWSTDILRGINKILMALMWALIGPFWWKTHKLLAISFLVVSFVNILHAALIFIR